MKRIVIVLLLVFLSGCSGPAWETVTDPLETQTLPVWQDQIYEIQLGIPENVTLLEKTPTMALYSSKDGELEIETSTFLCSGVEQAVKRISGFPADRLTILKTQRFDLPEYQFAWVSETEQGTRLYRADLVLDGTCCYAVVCSSLELAGDYAAFQARQVFGSFGLLQNQGI